MCAILLRLLALGDCEHAAAAVRLAASRARLAAMRRSWKIMLALGMLGTTFCNLTAYTGSVHHAVSGSILTRSCR